MANISKIKLQDTTYVIKDLDAYVKPSTGIPASDLASGVIPDVSNFITNSVNDLANYYLKSDTYTKTEVAELIGAINQFHYEIAASTSAVDTPASNVLYLIGPTGSGSDQYEEYVYSSDWVKIGDTSIDLSGYVTITALNTALADYTTTADLTTLLAGKQDAINDLSDIRSGAAAGATAYQKPATGIPASDIATGVIPDISGKQDTLVSGTNIKTINNESILGSGNIITETTNNKVTSISEQSTDEQYPSAKLLYDMLFEKLVVPVNVISGGTIEDVIGTNITVFDNDHNVTIATKEFQGDPLIFRIKAGINYTLSGESIDPFESPVSVDYKSELDSIRNYTIQYFDSPIINFVDPNVAAICINNWGNGEIITEKMVRAVTTLSNEFQGNTEIEAFDELRYFTSLSTINNNEFNGCTALETVEFPLSVTSIGEYAFASCTNLQIELNLPNLTGTLYKGAFNGTKITKILSLGSITTIESKPSTNWDFGAFQNCTELTDAILPNTLTSIGNNAFTSCTKLANIILPNALTSIGDQAFYGCTKLNNVIFPNTLTSIGSGAFHGCELEDAELNFQSLVTLGTAAFFGTKITKILSLGSITTIPDSITGYSNHGTFANCSELTSVVLPNTLTHIGSSAFGGCSKLEGITLPNGLVSIGGSAFSNCSLIRSITIPSSVTSIGSYIFYYCTNLTELTCEATTPPSLGGNAFKACGITHIYVPAASVDAYKTATNWNALASIIEAIPTA